MSFEIVSVVGPTASGKSDLAISLALELGGCEIINTDSMQLYRGMDIGTAKLSESEMRGVPHHLISCLNPDSELSVVEYRELFDEAVSSIQSRGHRVVTVGGSTLYLSAALDEMNFAPTDFELRDQLEAELQEQGSLQLWERLRSVDPDAANKIPASNARRVIRALEVIALTGQAYNASLPEPVYRRSTLQIGIAVPREVLIERIERRVQAMWQGGLVEEVAGLLRDYPKLSRTARVAIGYQQAAQQLAGELSEDEAIAQTIQLTTRYAKKQMTWLRRDSRIKWLDFSDDLPQAALELIRLG